MFLVPEMGTKIKQICLCFSLMLKPWFSDRYTVPVSSRCSGPAAALRSSSPSSSPPWSSDRPAESCVWTCPWPRPAQRGRKVLEKPGVAEQTGSSTSLVSHTHHVDDELAETLPLSFGEVLENVTVFLVEEFEAHRQVMVLQNRLVVVHERQLRV